MGNKALVLGAGGFIGGHLVSELIFEGAEVTAVDVKRREDWHQWFEDSLNYESLDSGVFADFASLGREEFNEVYNLAADMGGIGFIENNKIDCMMSVFSTVVPLRMAASCGWGRVFYSSSACVYPSYKQNRTNEVKALREVDAYPADPEDGYGWEKLFGERMHRHFYEEIGLETRVARYHNIYGPQGTWSGGREKAPAALCRKVAYAALTGKQDISIWGDGTQARSYCHVNDCVDGTIKLMRSDVRYPLNVGSSELVSVNELLDVIEAVAGTSLVRKYVLDAPQGVAGRNSDNTLIKKDLDWEPSISLRSGIEETYPWIYDQVKATL